MGIGLGVGYFCPTPTPDVQLDHFLHHTPKLGIPVEYGTTYFETFVETEISFRLPRFQLILTAKFHSHCVKESEILYRMESESEILQSRSRIFHLRLRNPGNNSPCTSEERARNQTQLDCVIFCELIRYYAAHLIL